MKQASGLAIAMVTLVVDDYDAGLAFYQGVLGFDCAEDKRLSDTKRWVVVRPPGNSGAALLLAKAADQRQTDAIGNQTGGRVGFFLTTDNFARDHALFLGRGVQFCEAPRREAYGQVAVFADPWGNRWDLIELL